MSAIASPLRPVNPPDEADVASPADPQPGALAAQRLALPGGYVWISTVMVPAFFGSRAIGARTLACVVGLSLALAVSSYKLHTTQRGRVRSWALYAFVALSAVTWVALARQRTVWPDGAQTVLGGLAWLLFVLSVPDREVITDASKLKPVVASGGARRGAHSTSTFALLAATSLLPLLAAAAVVRDPQASLAHSIACAAALAGFALAARIATLSGTWQTNDRAARRLARAWVSLVLLAVALALGALLGLI